MYSYLLILLKLLIFSDVSYPVKITGTVNILVQYSDFPICIKQQPFIIIIIIIINSKSMS